MFNKGVKAIQYRKESIFQQVVLRKLDIHIQRDELRPLTHTIYKN